MSLPRLYTGSRTVLEPALAEVIADHQAGDPLRPVHVLVGETLLRPYLRRRLADLMGGHLGVRFVTTGELGMLLGERALLAQGRHPLPFLADRVLAGEIMDGHDGYFAAVAEMPGFGGALFRTLRELRLSGISPGDLTAAVPTTEDPRGKLASIADLYRRYEDLRSGYFTPDDGLACADPEQLGPGGLIVYGLWEPPALLLRVLEQIVERAPLTVLTPRTGTDADRVLEPLWAWLQTLDAERADLEPEAPEHTLAGVRAGLFTSVLGQGMPDDGSVRLVSAPDPAREVRDAVRTAARWAADGIPLREIAIAYRHADRYRGLLDEALREADLPVYLHEGTPLSERPLGRQVLALLDLLDGDLERSAVMAFVADARLPDETWERYGKVSPGRWDSISREAGVVRGAEQWRRRLEAYRAEREARYGDDPPRWLPEELAAIDALTAFVADLHEALSAMPERGEWVAHIDALRELISRYVDGAARLDGALDGLRTLDVLPGEVPSRRAVDAVRALVENLRAADVLSGREGAFGVRGVQVLDVNSLRSLGYRAVIVLGLNERAFPPPPRQDSLLLDAERRALNDRHGWRLPLRAFGDESESLQFAGVLAAADERVQVSFPRTQDGRQSPLLPSTFVRAVAASLLGAEIDAAKLDTAGHPAIVRLRSGRVTVEDPDDALSATEHLRAQLESGEPVARALARRRFPRLDVADRVERDRWGPRFSAYDGVLSEAGAAAAAQLWALQRPLSTTALERYAECPHRFLLGTVLGLRDRAEPEDTVRIDALNKGSLVHRVLERFVRDRDPLASPEQQRDLLFAIADDELQTAEAHGLTGYPLLWRLDRAEILDDLERWLQVELDDPQTFANGELEVRFGPPRPGDAAVDSLTRDEPLTVDLGDGLHVEIQGVIDRVDWTGGDGFRVTDYKTGVLSPSRYKDDRLFGGQRLQLPLYLFAAARALGVNPEDGDARYLSVSRRGGFRAVGFSGGTLAERRAELDDLLRSLVSGIRGGDFHLEPEDRRCQWCDFDGVCDPRRARIRERKARDPRAIEAERRGDIE